MDVAWLRGVCPRVWLGWHTKGVAEGYVAVRGGMAEGVDGAWMRVWLACGCGVVWLWGSVMGMGLRVELG